MDISKIKVNNNKVVLNTINTMIDMLTMLQLKMSNLQKLIDFGSSIPGIIKDPEVQEMVSEHKRTCETIDDLKNCILAKKEKYNEESKLGKTN